MFAGFDKGHCRCKLCGLPPDTATGIYDAVFLKYNSFGLNLSTEVIQELRSKGIGWGEITLAASLASSSGKTLDEVIAMADSELGWGKIVEELGVDPKTLGHGVSEVIESAKDGRVDKDALENAAISDLLASNFGLEDSEVAALAESGIRKQDVLMALSAAAITGDAGTFEKALALRQESRNWQDVSEAVGIDPKGARDMGTVMQRSEIKEQLKELALLPRKTRHFQRVLNDQPLEVQAEFYRHIFREVKGDDFYKDLERHVRHRFYEARDEFKELLGMLDDPDAIQALMHVIALTEEGWLAGELIRIVLAHDPEQAREPVRHALESGDYLLQCLGIYLAGKSKSDPLLEELSRFYRRPFGDKVDRLERKSYEALLEGSEGVSDDLILRWLRDSSARVREVGIIAAARRRLKASVEDLVRLVLVDNRTRPRAAQALLDFEAEGLLEFSPEDEAGRAMAGILNAAKREPLLNMLKELTRDENATVRELTVKLVRLLDEPAPLAGARWP